MVEGNVGTVGTYDVEFKDGKLVAKLDVAKEIAPGVSISGDLSIGISARAALEAIKKAIPGTIDDALIDLVEKATGI